MFSALLIFSDPPSLFCRVSCHCPVYFIWENKVVFIYTGDSTKCNQINLLTIGNTLSAVQLCVSTGRFSQSLFSCVFPPARSVSLSSCYSPYVTMCQLTSVKSSAFFSASSRIGKLLTLSAFSCSYNTMSAVLAIPTARVSELTEFS